MTVRDRLAERFKTFLDPIDLFFGLLPALTGYVAFVSWAGLIVRAIRGEEVEEGWRELISSSAFLTTRALVSGTQVRETVALRGAAVEMRELVREAAKQAQLRGQREADRDRQESERQARLYRLTKWLVALATLTLAAAVVTLAVSIVS